MVRVNNHLVRVAEHLRDFGQVTLQALQIFPLTLIEMVQFTMTENDLSLIFQHFGPLVVNMGNETMESYSAAHLYLMQIRKSTFLSKPISLRNRSSTGRFLSQT